MIEKVKDRVLGNDVESVYITIVGCTNCVSNSMSNAACTQRKNQHKIRLLCPSISTKDTTLTGDFLHCHSPLDGGRFGFRDGSHGVIGYRAIDHHELLPIVFLF
jgi:hypothetical protein